MVLADCESEMIREPSRGLEGGSFFLATLLNRREAKVGKGKDSLDAIKDYIHLKSDAQFCQLFIHKLKLDPDIDNTPAEVKQAEKVAKKRFLNELVADVLKDLLPLFKDASLECPNLDDHPLQRGRIPLFNCIINDNAANIVDQNETIEITQDMIKNSMKESIHVTSTGHYVVYSCKLCLFQFRFQTTCKTHIATCLRQQLQLNTKADKSQQKVSNGKDDFKESGTDMQDYFWNYKKAEFFFDSLMEISNVYEKFGDGLGCFIVSKILLPIFHGLKHSNYSSSIHRFITRILCEATPLEGMKLIHERFSNRNGKSGENIFRDRRMEFRIGIAKKLIGNLGGSNFNEDSVKHVNSTLDIKEELFYETRKSHGVNIRSGNHNPRSDDQDYKILFSHLTDTKAHVQIPGRTFGDLRYPSNIMNHDRFDKTAFCRWVVRKNKEAVAALKAKK